MDGVKCPFTRLHEIQAWEAAQKVADPALALFGLMLTEDDLTFLHHFKIWGIDDRRK